ncbi:protein of unknown function [Shewanella benthica]|uniref:Uncharacterized protein n=1 Tax=Shewanella benthica TaxID=43661 RepID=A0A330M6M1_9GAMM|nr:protein of unknown function [Shewanella benthica]
MQFIRLVLVFCSKLGKVSAAITSEQPKNSQNARLKHKNQHKDIISCKQA